MNTTELLPTLDNCAQGIVAKSQDARGRNVYTLQCQHCAATETPAMLVLMTFKFNPVRDKKHGRIRLCPDCRMASYHEQGLTPNEIRVAKGG